LRAVGSGSIARHQNNTFSGRPLLNERAVVPAAVIVVGHQGESPRPNRAANNRARPLPATRHVAGLPGSPLNMPSTSARSPPQPGTTHTVRRQLGNPGLGIFSSPGSCHPVHRDPCTHARPDGFSLSTQLLPEACFRLIERTVHGCPGPLAPPPPRPAGAS
jgi:hypothetical protein